MQALIAARISGTHCNFCISGCCAALKVVVAAVARQKITVNPAIVDLFMVSLRRCLFRNCCWGISPLRPGPLRRMIRAGSIDRARARWDQAESPSRSRFLFEHDLRANALRLSRGKPLHTFPDHALPRDGAAAVDGAAIGTRRRACMRAGAAGAGGRAGVGDGVAAHAGKRTGVVAGPAGAAARTAGRPATARSRSAAGAGPCVGAGSARHHHHRRDGCRTQIRLDRKHASLLTVTAPHRREEKFAPEFCGGIAGHRPGVTFCIARAAHLAGSRRLSLRYFYKGTSKKGTWMNQRPHILVIEDDIEIRSLLRDYLAREGFRVDVGDGGAALDRFRATLGEPDLVVLDIMLPGEDGPSICRRLRAGPRVPILMLTAKGEDIDRIVGLEMGADDYLPKPFNPRELVARINAVLRRLAAPLPPGAPAVEPEQVSFGNMTINLATRTLERDGQSMSLTTGEFALLKVLVTNPRTPLSRGKLMELARGREYEVFDRSIDVQISRLRKLVEQDPANPAYIQTVWGFGYVFVPDGRQQ